MGKTKASAYVHAAAMLMILALVWLTISIPFVYAAEKALKAQTQSPSGCEDSNPFANTTEEKSETNTTSVSEYLIVHISQELTFTVVIKIYNRHSADLYFAFRPEAIYPPPKA